MAGCVNLARAGRPHKLSDRARRRLVREATKTPMTTQKELKASAAEMGETLHTTTFARVLHQSKLYGREPLLGFFVSFCVKKANLLYIDHD